MSETHRALSLTSLVLSCGLRRLPTVRRRARAAVRAAFRLALRRRSKPYTATGIPVALVIAPHPDDEALGCAGLIAGKRRQGHPVHVVYVTDGAAAHPGHPSVAPARLAVMRKAEAHAALDCLGVEPACRHFLDAADGTLARQSAIEANALSARLRALIEQVRPDEIFVPCRGDGSSDHAAVFARLMQALATLAAPRLYEFPIWSWWNPLLLSAPLLRSRRTARYRFPADAGLKRRAIACHRTQVLPVPPQTIAALSPDFLAAFENDEEFFFEF